MSWRERTAVLWETYGQRYPLDFVLGWIANEQPDNAARATSLGEVGWFQITPEEARNIGYAIDVIPTDETYSFRAGIALLDWYARKVDTRFTGSAYFAMIKLWHTLPVCAQYVNAKFPGASDSWDAVKAFVTSDPGAADRYILAVSGRAFSSLRMVQQTDKVMQYDSSSFDFLAPVFDLAGFEDDTDTGVFVVVGVIAILAAVA